MRYAALVALVALATGCAMDAGETDRIARPIVDGEVTHDYPAVGVLYSSGGACTGTLIGCSTVLTAGHCVCGDGESSLCDLASADEVSFFLPHRGSYQASDVVVHPDYGRPNGTLVADVAVIELAEPVLGIEPMAIVQTAPGLGAQMTMVGYGRVDSDNSYEVGVKRLGTAPVGDCSFPEDEDVHQCRGVGDRTCQGDSGGPALEGTGPSALIAGITSYGYPSDGHPFDELTDCGGLKVSAEVAFYADWIEDQAGIDLGTDACGTFPAVGEGALVEVISAQMVEDDQLELSMEVPRGTSELHLTWNGHLAYMDPVFGLRGVSTFMSLTEGRPEGDDEIINNVCDADQDTCLARSPAGGLWTGRFRLEEGVGEYQLTMTAYGDAPIAEPDDYQVAEDSFIQIGAAEGVLTNDTPSSRGGNAVVFDQPLNGQLALRGDGSFDYQPNSDFKGTDTFSYRLDDGEYTSQPTVVTIEVVDQAGCGCRTQRPTGSWWLALAIGVMAIRRRRRAR